MKCFREKVAPWIARGNKWLHEMFAGKSDSINCLWEKVAPWIVYGNKWLPEMFAGENDYMYCLREKVAPWIVCVKKWLHERFGRKWFHEIIVGNGNIKWCYDFGKWIGQFRASWLCSMKTLVVGLNQLSNFVD